MKLELDDAVTLAQRRRRSGSLQRVVGRITQLRGAIATLTP